MPKLKQSIFEESSLQNTTLKSSQLFEIGRNTKNLSILYEDSLMDVKESKSLKESIDFQLKEFLSRQIQEESLYLEDYKVNESLVKPEADTQ